MIEALIATNPNLYEANTYIVSDQGEAIIVDPFTDYEKIVWKARRRYKVKALVATHGHSDHIGGMAELAVELQVPVMIHPAEQAYLTALNETPFSLIPIQEGDFVQVGTKAWQVINSPGHSPGGISLYSKDEKALICGDVLFQNSIGRTDIDGSNWELLRKSLREKIFTLPGDTRVYPGHGAETTLDVERTGNAYMGLVFGP
jgi:glyoxylase-like metal-dependent hydrolase (beta-lactamase superfamily II)